MRSLRLFLLSVLVMVAMNSSADEPSPLLPWRVYVDSAPVLSAPDRAAQPVTTLLKDDLVSGTLQVDSETNDEWLAFDKNREHLYVSRINLTRPHPANLVKGDLPYGREIVNRWWGIPLTYEPSDIVPIPKKYFGEEGSYELRREARDQLVKMLDAAENKGVKIRVVSAYRSGALQVRIYSQNTRRNPSQRSSAPPGHSEHQLGTTVDLADVEQQHVLNASFEMTEQSKWLEANAAEFGFLRTYYPDNISETGYVTEPWHWRYMGREIALKKKADRAKQLSATSPK